MALDEDVVRGPLQGQHPGEHVDRGLAGVIRGDQRVRLDGVVGPDIDDLAVAALDHVRGYRAAAVEQAVQVRRHHPAPLLVRHTGVRTPRDPRRRYILVRKRNDRKPEKPPRVVDQDFDRAEAVDRPFDQRVDVARSAHVGGDGYRLPAQRPNLRGRRLDLRLGPRRGDDVRARLGQHECDRTAYSAPRAGDYRGPALEAHLWQHGYTPHQATLTGYMLISRSGVTTVRPSTIA